MLLTGVLLAEGSHLERGALERSGSDTELGDGRDMVRHRHRLDGIPSKAKQIEHQARDLFGSKEAEEREGGLPFDSPGWTVGLAHVLLRRGLDVIRGGHADDIDESGLGEVEEDRWMSRRFETAFLNFELCAPFGLVRPP